MSQHDLVSAQISNVRITHHAALNAIAYIVCVKHAGRMAGVGLKI